MIKKDNDRVVTYDPKTKLYTNSSNTIKIKNVYDARAYNKLMDEPTATPSQIEGMAKRIENARQYGGEKLFQNMFDKNGLRFNSKKPITNKMKSNRAVLKSIKPLNVDEYLKVRNEVDEAPLIINPVRYENLDKHQGIGSLDNRGRRQGEGPGINPMSFFPDKK